MTFDDYPDRRGGVRASDAEREQVADALRRNHADGRLDDDELDARLEACYRTRTVAELRRLLSDLPEGRPAGGGWPDGPGGLLGGRRRSGGGWAAGSGEPGGPLGSGRPGGPLGPGGPGRWLSWPPVLAVVAFVGVLSLLGGWLWGGPYGGHLGHHPHPPFILPLLVAFVVWRLVRARRRGGTWSDR